MSKVNKLQRERGFDEFTSESTLVEKPTKMTNFTAKTNYTKELQNAAMERLKEVERRGRYEIHELRDSAAQLLKAQLADAGLPDKGVTFSF